MTRSASSKDKDDEEGDAPKVEEVDEEDKRRRRRLSRRSPTSGSWSTSRSPSGVGVLDDGERTISGGLLDVLLVIVVLGGNLHANSCQANKQTSRTSKQANIRHAFNNMAHALTIAMHVVGSKLITISLS